MSSSESPDLKWRETCDILDVIESLSVSGSTNNADDIQETCEPAPEHFDAGATKRVILGTKGDFNVGVASPEYLERFGAAVLLDITRPTSSCSVSSISEILRTVAAKSLRTAFGRQFAGG